MAALISIGAPLFKKMKIVYVILVLLNVAALSLAMLYFFNELDNNPGLLPMAGLLAIIILLILLLFYSILRYFKIPVRHHVK